MEDNPKNLSTELYGISKRLKRYCYINLILEVLLAPLIVFVCYLLVIPYDCSVSTVFMCTTPPLRVLGVLIAIYYICGLIASCNLVVIAYRLTKPGMLHRKMIKAIEVYSIFMGIFIIPIAFVARDSYKYFSRNDPNIHGDNEKQLNNTIDKSDQYTRKTITWAKWAFVLNLIIIAILAIMLLTGCKSTHSCLTGNLFLFPIVIVGFILVLFSFVDAVIANDILQRRKLKVHLKPFLYPLIDLVIMIVAVAFMLNF